MLFLLVTALAVTTFVNRFVKRPVALLATGVARSARGAPPCTHISSRTTPRSCARGR